MEDNDNGRCMHGCYPVDIDKIREIAREKGPEEAQEWIDENQPSGEPYIGAKKDEKHHRKFKIVAGGQGDPFDAYIATVDRLVDTPHDYTADVVHEWMHASPGSQLHQELMQRKREAQGQINQTLSSLSDLYQQKHLLEHDIRKLEQKQEHFEDKKEEALKADFVDEVDANTGRASILQMQSNDIFPSITADFYAMKSMEDLTSGHLKDLPEQEKAILRKKWKLYQKWKEKFGNAIDRKLKDVRARYKSVKTSITQTEEWIKPYVQTVKQLEGDFEEKVEELSDPYLVTGYSSLMRGLKLLAHNVRNITDDGSPAHRDVMIVEARHASLAGSDQPQRAGGGGTVMIMNFKEYLVCEHVFQEVFQPQIDAKENEVRRYIAGYKGEEVPEGVEEHTEKEFEPYKQSSGEKLLHSIYKMLGIGDEYYLRDPSSLRKGLMGPGFGGSGCPLYIEIKFDTGMNVMK
ncbi:MAG: hypothetical protein SVV03_04560 [Candidatus Nanohaloarchaea archaeon]|nr:hypothetical protein [Candidatus Nanohaloarchaea archaeon]